MLGPDYPFDYARYLRHSAGLGTVPATRYGSRLAVIGLGISGTIVAYEALKMGLHPVVYEARNIGGRLCTRTFSDGPPNAIAELGAMRFPKSSKSLFHYINKVGLETTAFANPLSPATPSTVINLKGHSFHARTMQDLPNEFQDVARKWRMTLEEGAALGEIHCAMRSGNAAAVKQVWNTLVPHLDDKSFHTFLCDSPHFSSFHDREMFGQVGFGCGGWNTDFPNSMLEILRVLANRADQDHRAIVGGSSQLPQRLWARTPRSMVHWPAGTSLGLLHPSNTPLGKVTELTRLADNSIAVTDARGVQQVFDAVVFTPQPGVLLSQIDSDRSLLPADHWTAIERMHYMPSSKIFVAVDRPFWLDSDHSTGRDVMSMTLTDRMLRGVYLFGSETGGDATICLSYTWGDDSLKWMPLNPSERLEVALRSLKEIYPRVDVRRHIRGSPQAISWETEPGFMGAFRAGLPGDYRNQRLLFKASMRDSLSSDSRGFFLAGDSVSFAPGFAEGAVQSGLNTLWAVQRYFGGTSAVGNPGPGDCYDELAPLRL